MLTAFKHIVFWSIPIIGLVIVLRAQIVRVLLGSGAFDWSDTRLTAAMLAVFVISLVAQAVLLLLIRAFYAGGKTLVPLLVAIGSGLFSIASALFLRFIYLDYPSWQAGINNIIRLNDVQGAEVLVLALAFTVGQFVQLGILLLVSTKTFSISYKPLLYLFIQACAASLVGAVSAYFTLVFIVNGINQETFIGILLQGFIAGVVGFVAIILVYKMTGSTELKEIHKTLQVKFSKKNIIASQEE